MIESNIVRAATYMIFFVFSLFAFKNSVPQIAFEPSVDNYKIFSTQTAAVFGSLGIDEETKEDFTPDVFSDLDLKAANIFVVDLNEDWVIFEKNAFEARPLASVTKLLTALIAEERIPPGIYISISLGAVKQEGDSGFAAGDNYKKEDLIDFMLVDSSNDAAYALAEFVSEGLSGEPDPISKFVILMNDRVRELGAKNTSFFNVNGLDIADGNGKRAGALGTAEDISTLAEYIYRNYPNIFTRTKEAGIKISSLAGKIVSAKNTNRAFSEITQLIGSKTGYTDLSGGNLVFIFDAGFSRPVLVSLLGSTEEGRFEDAKTISDAILEYFQNKGVEK